MLEGRTREGPRLVFSHFVRDGKVRFLCIKPDGLIEEVPLEQLSVDWHHDPEKGWQRDFQDEASD